MKSIGEKIKNMRRNRRLSQQDLATISGIKQSMMSRIEDPENEMLTLRSLRRVADALNCDLQIDLKPRVKLVFKPKRESTDILCSECEQTTEPHIHCDECERWTNGESNICDDCQLRRAD